MKKSARKNVPANSPCEYRSGQYTNMQPDRIRASQTYRRRSEHGRRHSKRIRDRRELKRVIRFIGLRWTNAEHEGKKTSGAGKYFCTPIRLYDHAQRQQMALTQKSSSRTQHRTCRLISLRNITLYRFFLEVADRFVLLSNFNLYYQYSERQPPAGCLPHPRFSDN